MLDIVKLKGVYLEEHPNYAMLNVLPSSVSHITLKKYNGKHKLCNVECITQFCIAYNLKEIQWKTQQARLNCITYCQDLSRFLDSQSPNKAKNVLSII